MNRLLNALWGLGNTLVDVFQNVRSRFFVIVMASIPLIIFEWMMNYWGFLAVNAAIFFILFGIAFYRWSHPAVIIGVTALEKAVQEKFSTLLTHIIMWLSIASMFLATLPFGWYLSFREAFGLFLIAMVFLSAISWMAYHGWFETTIYKKLIKKYAVIGFMVCVWILIPGSFKYWLTGIDFYSSAGTSESAKAFAKAKRTINIKVDKDSASMIKGIGEELANGKKFSDLSKDQQATWKKAEGETLPNKLSDLLSDISWPTLPTWTASSAEAKVTADAEVKAPAAKETPPAISSINGRWKLDWKKPEGYPGTTSHREGFNFVNIVLTANCSQIEITEVDNQATFVGDQLDETTFTGSWKSSMKEEGNFFLRFSSDYKNGQGWYRDKGKKVNVPIQLTRT